MDATTLINHAKRTISIETQSIAGLLSYINHNFVKAVEIIFNSKGRLVVSGIGKSAIVAQKMVATFNSTGTPSLYMHAADAIHGDLGMIQADDVVMVVSKSGNSPEIKVLIPLIKNFGNTLIGMVGNTTSVLAQDSNIFLNTTVEQEACSHNLAPTSSSTAQMVMGDALAVCLMEWRGFKGSDFAKLHPGGMLGKKLYLKVQDIFPKNEKPWVYPTSTLKEVILSITSGRLGMTVVVTPQQQLIGVITDGDLRRMLEKNLPLEEIKGEDIMTTAAKTIHPDALAIESLNTLRENDITQLVVVEKELYVGILHLHDLLREGFI
jgi:arabinose-5-phosphate isomerase